MKRVYVIFLLITLLVRVASAQSTRVNVAFVNSKDFSGGVYLYNPSAHFNPAKKGAIRISLNSSHAGSGTVDIKHAEAVNLDVYYSTVKGKSPDINISYTLFLSPGDDLTLKIDLSKKTNNITVTGKGDNNNQPEIFALTDIFSNYELANGKTPYQLINIINKQQKSNKVLLNNYIARYKPSYDFIKISQLNLKYYSAAKFFLLKARNLDPTHNSGPWQKAQDSLFNVVKNSSVLAPKLKAQALTVKLNNSSKAMIGLNSKDAAASQLNNDDALAAYNYSFLVSFFVEREYERLLIEETNNPKAFYKEMYNKTVAGGKKLFIGDEKNLLREKLINKYFTGQTAEYLYADWLKEDLVRSDYKNIDLIFDHFKQKYPRSQYLADFKGPIDAIVKQRSQTLTDKMVFAPGNGSKLNTLKQVVALTKGKTVLVDMWGIWCSPCRESIEQHSAALEAYFKGKGVNFLYIANNDMTHEKEWKKLIAYYHMEGTHILANEKLDKDIMDKVKSNGYPTYFIIKKDGSYKLTKTQYPINRQAMINELLAASK